MTDVNVPLLRKLVEFAEWQETLSWQERIWNQGGWVWTFRNYQEETCRTAYCIAGYVGHLDGVLRRDADGKEMAFTNNGEHVSVYAMRKLGIPSDEVEPDDSEDGSVMTRLFQPGNSAEEIREIAEELAGERL